MAIERRLTEIVGPVGGKLHTARSRNDQVATDVALFVRAHADRDRRALLDLMEVLVGLAEAHLDWPMPGYTHLQRAQPVYLSHHLLAWFWKLRRDPQRFAFVIDAAGELPLGAGALAGVNFDTDRRFVAAQLGFAGGGAELDRRGLEPRLRARLPARRRHLRDAPVAARRRDRALVERGVRLLRGRRRVRLGLEHHAAEEEPGRRGAAARQGAARGRATWPRCTACCTACRSPTTRTCRRTRSACSTRSTRSSSPLRAAAGMLAGDLVRPRAHGRRGRRRVPRRHRHRRPAGAPRSAVPRGPRDRRRPGAPGDRLGPQALRARRRRAEPPELVPRLLAELLAERRLARVEGLGGRHRRSRASRAARARARGAGGRPR